MFSGIVVIVSLLVVSFISFIIGFKYGYKDCEKRHIKRLISYRTYLKSK